MSGVEALTDRVTRDTDPSHAASASPSTISASRRRRGGFVFSLIVSFRTTPGADLPPYTNEYRRVNFFSPEAAARADHRDTPDVRAPGSSP